MDIVRLHRNDIKDALSLIWFVFREFETPADSTQGVAAYRAFISYDSILEKAGKEELIFWGCFMSGHLAGIIAIRDNNHICMFFIKKDYQKQGIAKGLLQTVMVHCKAVGHIHRITVNSSPYAAEIYRRLGFMVTNTQQTVNGVRFIPMECPIDGECRGSL